MDARDFLAKREVRCPSTRPLGRPWEGESEWG